MFQLLLVTPTEKPGPTMVAARLAKIMVVGMDLRPRANSLNVFVRRVRNPNNPIRRKYPVTVARSMALKFMRS